MSELSTIRWFGGAAEAAGTDAEPTAAITLGEALDAVTATRPAVAKVLPLCAILLDGVRTDDRSASLAGVTHIDVLPPFAGG